MMEDLRAIVQCVQNLSFDMQLQIFSNNMYYSNSSKIEQDNCGDPLTYKTILKTILKIMNLFALN